jgi:hypothetical protein
MPSLLGGLFIGVLSALPFIGICNCCCLWIVSGGVLAAYLEQQKQTVSLTLARGARVGVLAGLIGAVVWLAIDFTLSPLQEQFSEVMRGTRDVPPEIEDFIEWVRTGPGRIVYGFLLLCLCAIVSAIGGMMGAAYFKKDVPAALGGPTNPPPLP